VPSASDLAGTLVFVPVVFLRKGLSWVTGIDHLWARLVGRLLHTSETAVRFK
jgi:hypothetical protein